MEHISDYISEGILKKKTGLYGKNSQLSDLTKDSKKDEIIDTLLKFLYRCNDGISKTEIYGVSKNKKATVFAVWNRMGNIIVCKEDGHLFDIYIDTDGSISQIWEHRHNNRDDSFSLISKYLESISTLDMGIEKLKTMILEK